MPLTYNTYRYQVLECTLSTLLELQSRLGNKPLKLQVVCPQSGTAVLKGLKALWNEAPHRIPRLLPGTGLFEPVRVPGTTLFGHVRTSWVQTQSTRTAHALPDRVEGCSNTSLRHGMLRQPYRQHFLISLSLSLSLSLSPSRVNVISTCEQATQLTHSLACPLQDCAFWNK